MQGGLSQNIPVEGEKYYIPPENCLHCGRCFEKCPIQNIERIN
ncbi:4Fe-4S binding protein [Methanobrevibacter sp.]